MPALTEIRPSVVVVSGWSTFAAQAAIAWCGLKDVPYVLVVESHDEGPRAGWRRTVKGTVVPPVVQRASGILVTGTLARDSMIARGAAPERVHLFANTIDVEGFGERCRATRGTPARVATGTRRGAGRRRRPLRRTARAGEGPRRARSARSRRPATPRLVLALAGEGPERARLQARARELGVRLALIGDVDWDRIVEPYVVG